MNSDPSEPYNLPRQLDLGTSERFITSTAVYRFASSLHGAQWGGLIWGGKGWGGGMCAPSSPRFISESNRLPRNLLFADLHYTLSVSFNCGQC